MMKIGPKKPSARPFATFSCMPDTNLFLMFTQRLNTLGVPYMVSDSVTVIIYTSALKPVSWIF